MQKITIYTDGACSGNPGPGGWAAVLISFNQGWIYNWLKKDWKTADGSDVKNKEIWQEIYKLTKKHKVNFNKVKGHSDVELNNRCDELARNEILKIKSK